MTRCSKPNCSKPGAALLGYNYALKLAVLVDAGAFEPSPHVYVLCSDCADTLRPPRGWELDDRRAVPALFVDDHDRPRFVTQVESMTAPEPAHTARQVFFGYS